METLQRTLETWIRDRSSRIMRVKWTPPWKMVVKLPWTWTWPNQRIDQQRKIKEEVESGKRQLQELCRALKAETVAELQEILCCMVLSECVYKRPASELLRTVNKFKADFGGQIISLERVQPSSDLVPHRYLLAESGDTLFASFVGTKQYKDVVADANIFQGAIFHDNDTPDATNGTERLVPEGQVYNVEIGSGNVDAASKGAKFTPKPAVHRGFMSRAKGIPALELYRLARKKRRKLVLCGHSLGGAVAVLATLAILRVVGIASKENEKVQVKCITFSQPPVGNAALRDYVNGKGWQRFFKTYCIPEDLVPRILSPAYFHHYNSQNPSGCTETEESPSFSKPGKGSGKQKAENVRQNVGERLVLGLGPVQSSFWRLSRLVPLEGLMRHISKYTAKSADPLEADVTVGSSSASSIDDAISAPQSLEIEEGSDGISLHPLPEKNEAISGGLKNEKQSGNGHVSAGKKLPWRAIPSLPSYVPFGQLYLLGSSSVESLSGSEYSKLTSVRSVITELKERLQSHSMRSYRSRFQKIYDLYMNENAFSFCGGEQEPYFPHLQKLLGISVSSTIELGHIVDSPIISAATSLVPLGWNGFPFEKNVDPLKVDISGFDLHLCTSVQVRVNGNWFSTVVESFPSTPSYSRQHEIRTEMQKLRIRIGAPLRRPPTHQILEETLIPAFLSIDASVDAKLKNNKSLMDEKFIHPDDFRDFVVFCTTDFSTIAKKIQVRTRRVQLIGLEGAGKTSLLKAILDLGRSSVGKNNESSPPEVGSREGIAGGLLYSDSAGIDLQNLSREASNFRDELWEGIRDLSKKIDMVVLVHNLSHRVPRSGQSLPAALSQLIDEAKFVGIPWVLAITNKFSVSAHQQKEAINAAIQAYQSSSTSTAVINSCPYVMPSAASGNELTTTTTASDVQRNLFLLAPLNLVRKPFRKKPVVLPVEGVTTLCNLIHNVLRSNEEAAMQDLSRDRIFVELAREGAAGDGDFDGKSNRNNIGLGGAALGASVGAGVGIVLAVVMGAASALRKP
ncbi:lipase class 3 family protein [Genlisea aurea]|uniref:Lipase class 3 family protein n=1 Tax=Genlisea aurea TaxID=192259 RepID=S8D401_9LAMI|nr:lipase class 3 family protein [Genlisea aurea]